MRSSLLPKVVVLRKALNVCGAKEALGRELSVSAGDLR